MDQIDIFDFMPGGEKYKPIKSTDWKWTIANDYPKEKNGLKVFSCFACGGGYPIDDCDNCPAHPNSDDPYWQMTKAVIT